MMETQLLLCISQEEVQNPYKFKMTNINVYSFEEALYHCFYYFKQSIDDFSSSDFLSWVKNDLGQSFLASKIKQLCTIKNAGDRLVGFLSLVDYFDEEQILNLREQISEWGKRLEWEHLKEQADYLIENGEPRKAALFYKQALDHENNKILLNNLGVALMQVRNFSEAAACFERALAHSDDTQKGESDFDFQITLNLIESSIYGKDFQKALKFLKKAEDQHPENPDVYYLFGEFNFEAENIRYCVDYFKKAISIESDTHYFIRIADVYLKLRQFDNALKILESSPKKDKHILLKQAQVCEKQNNIPASIKCIEKALFFEMNDVELWTKLAMYHRLNYDLKNAFAAISKALNISSENESTKIELARIRKAQGKIKEYQSVLHDIMITLKQDYRDSVELLNI